MKRIRSFLAAVLALSLVAGSVIMEGGNLPATEYGGDQRNHTVSAAVRKKTFTVQATADFTLQLPASWKNNYVMKSSKGKKKECYVTFYAKKCYRQTKQGWLFSIERFQDDSYKDWPSYEVVGKWDGFVYVAAFPTDVQFIGSTKAAVKQYQKLGKSVDNVVKSIRKTEV